MVHKLLRFVKLPLGEQKLFVEVSILLALMKLGLRFLPFNVLVRFITNRVSLTKTGNDNKAATIRRVSRVVRRAGKVVPGATCLPQALVTLLVLAKEGLPASLRIGVAQSADGKLEAHAWVEIRGKVIVGQLADLHRYKLLSPVKEAV